MTQPPPSGNASALASGRPIALVGMMGAGKSVVGRLLAARLGRPFIDTDDAIAAELGSSVRELFAREGEAAFRARERRFIAELPAYSRHVLALGGGMFVGADNVSAIRGAAWTVWLRATAGTLLARLSAAERAERPLLAGDGAPDRLAALLTERAPWYARAHVVIDTDGLAPAAVAARVAAVLALPCA